MPRSSPCPCACVCVCDCVCAGVQKLYKLLSEVKLEVETVIKTGRQIVQKQQTENPKAMDEQLTALKLLYNHLGAQVLAAALFSSRSLFKGALSDLERQV